MTADETNRQQGTVLVAEDDPATGSLVRDLLLDQGYATSLLSVLSPAAIRAAVGRLEPDCVLLDSVTHAQFGASWDEAAWAHSRRRPVPVVMFTAHLEAVREVEARKSERSAAVYAVLRKPFDIHVLLDTVARAVGSDPGSTARRLARRAAPPPWWRS